MPTKTVYAGYPEAFIYDQPKEKEKEKKEKAKILQHLLWGDWLSPEGETQNGFVKVRARGCTGWVKKSLIQKDPLLEITFVDIGQGDGCVVSAPRTADDASPGEFRHLVVDAGQLDNMRRYLRWRFNLHKRAQLFDLGVITHPDQDHYLGFRDLIEDPNVQFGTLFHSGVVERPSGLGELADGSKAVEPVLTQAHLAQLLADPSNVGSKQYPKLLKQALESGRCGAVQGLTAGQYLPGFEQEREISIEVLGPVPEVVGGVPRLRSFGDAGKTKNGHSVVLRLVYGKVAILLGGDLNIPAEEHLLRHYAGGKDGEQARAELRRRLGADIAKACHHGSADFSTTFLQAVNPLVTVISSGDEEPHAHPRADALGGIGRASRGVRPLIFSTELARSAKEAIKHPNQLRREYAQLFDAYEAAGTKPEERAKLRKKIDASLGRDLERSIATYGAINLRTDGQSVVMAYRLEKRRGGRRWDLYRLERNPAGELAYASQHGG